MLLLSHLHLLLCGSGPTAWPRHPVIGAFHRVLSDRAGPYLDGTSRSATEPTGGAHKHSHTLDRRIAFSTFVISSHISLLPSLDTPPLLPLSQLLICLSSAAFGLASHLHSSSSTAEPYKALCMYVKLYVNLYVCMLNCMFLI